eukprot:241699-Chlamydomonas_euryale.AAC.4
MCAVRDRSTCKTNKPAMYSHKYVCNVVTVHPCKDARSATLRRVLPNQLRSMFGVFGASHLVSARLDASVEYSGRPIAVTNPNNGPNATAKKK